TISDDLLFKKIFEETIDLIFQYKPALGAYMGKEGYEKKVAIGTPANYLEFITKLSELLDRVNKIDEDQLSPKTRRSFHVLKDTLVLFFFFHEEFPIWNRHPFGLEDIQQTIFVVLQRKGPIKSVAETIIAQLEQLPQFLEEFRSRFGGSPIPKVWQETSYEMIQSSPQFLDYLEMIFQLSIDEPLKNTLVNTIEKAKTAIKLHTSWLQTLRVDEDEFAWALGQKNFDTLLSLRKLPWDRKKISQTGYDLLDSLTKQAYEIAKQIDPTKTFDGVVDEINAHHPLRFEMVLEHAGNEANRAKEFIITHDLASIPASEKLVIAETPTYLAPLIPIAMYGPTPFYAPDQPGIYYITRPSSESNLKQFGFHSYYSLPNVMAHETYPGHHLDLCWNQNVGSPLSLITLLLSTLGAETAEGWAHYCEEMMLEQGFHDEIDTEKVKLTILLGQLWRAVRIIVDVELHCKQRTIDDAIQLLVDRAKIDIQTARAEVRRYTTAPGYQLSYLIGKLLIQDIRHEVKIKQGDQFKLKNFHDIILKSDDLPYYLLKELFDMQS
ncbi:MAG: DUF885 domain-containing protein, partial [Promethearchaeota archaeon]